MTAADILKQHQLKRTSCREGIIEVIMNAHEAYSEDEIRTKLDGNYDRTTFYRSFKTLVDKCILHKIVVDNQWVKYAINNAITHKEEHAHFFCKTCHTVKCLEDCTLPSITMPQGFTNEETEVIIKGTCAQCTSLSS